MCLVFPAVTNRRSTRCSAGVSLLLTAFAWSTSLRAESPPQFAPLTFLLGRWDANGDQAGATGGFTFAFDVQQQIILRTNYSNTPASSGRAASRHDDLMVIYLEGGKLKADYFDSEGHVIRYLVQSMPDTVVFVSEVTPSEPRYRLTYRRGASGMLNGAFEIAPAGKSDFAPYLSWRARKLR